MSKRARDSRQDASVKRAKKYASAHERFTAGANAFALEPGLRGFSITCTRGKERQSVKECLDLLTRYIYLEYPDLDPETSAPSPSQTEEPVESIEDQVAKEVEEIKEQGKKESQKLLVSLSTCTDCLIFLRTLPSIDPNRVLARLLPDLCRTRSSSTRFTLRIIPIIGSSYANPGDMEALGKTLLPPIFHPTSGPTPSSFAVIPSMRNNDKVDRMALIHSLAAIVGKDIPANLSKPDQVVVAEVLKSICLMGVLPNYYRYRKYNIRALVEEGERETEEEVKSKKSTSPQDKTEEE
ncbi:MAG: hypothetical protein DHS80DRAFT_21272 [Piptocephalis tieghemiana]|nr:MAG: hypothetical protein DHS80DRAFT_21272 [Piptocephalis tieghemiana]